MNATITTHKEVNGYEIIKRKNNKYFELWLTDNHFIVFRKLSAATQYAETH